MLLLRSVAFGLFAFLYVHSELALAQGADVARGADRPNIQPYAGCHSLWSSIEEDRSYRLAIGRAHKKNRFNPFLSNVVIDKWIEAKGRVTRHVYQCDQTRALAAIHDSYKNVLADGGYELVAQGYKSQSDIGGDIGSVVWLQRAFMANPYPRESRVALVSRLTSLGGSAYVAGVKEREQGRTLIAVAVRQTEDHTILIGIDVIEEKPAALTISQAARADASLSATMRENLATTQADATAMMSADAIGDGIARSGRVVLVGLSFDAGGSKLAQSSKPALDEIARFLKSRATSRFFIVGHSDLAGGFKEGEKVSEDRAVGVVEALTSDYGIALGRLEAHGVGPLSPLFAAGGGGGVGNARIELVRAEASTP